MDFMRSMLRYVSLRRGLLYAYIWSFGASSSMSTNKRLRYLACVVPYLSPSSEAENAHSGGMSSEDCATWIFFLNRMAC